MQNEVLFRVYKEGAARGAWLTVRVCRAEAQASGVDCFTDVPQKKTWKQTLSQSHIKEAGKQYGFFFLSKIS